MTERQRPIEEQGADALAETNSSGAEQDQEHPDEQEIDGGLGILVREKTIFHGSGVSGIKDQKKFTKAEEDTVGSGVYFTSGENDAGGYAKLRAERERGRNDGKKNPNAKPVIYEAEIRNLKLCDLRSNENITRIMQGFKPICEARLEEVRKDGKQWYLIGVLTETIALINKGGINLSNLKKITQPHGKLFSEYVESLGYDGLVTVEGGEGGGMQDHDTYLIFNANNVEIKNEKVFEPK